jgi:hypothetical protein
MAAEEASAGHKLSSIHLFETTHLLPQSSCMLMDHVRMTPGLRGLQLLLEAARRHTRPASPSQPPPTCVVPWSLGHRARCWNVYQMGFMTRYSGIGLSMTVARITSL